MNISGSKLMTVLTDIYNSNINWKGHCSKPALPNLTSTNRCCAWPLNLWVWNICVYLVIVLSSPHLELKKKGGLVREELLQNNTLENWTHQPSMDQSFFTQIPFSRKKYRVHLFVQKIYGFAICRGEYESSCLYYDYYFFLIIGCLCLRRTAKLRNGCALCWQIQCGALSQAKRGRQKCWWKKTKKKP